MTDKEEAGQSLPEMKMESSVKKNLKFVSRQCLSPLTSASLSTKKRSLCNVSKTPTRMPLDSIIRENCDSYNEPLINDCNSKEELWKMYSNLKKETIETDEKLRKLKIVEQHKKKIAPDDLISLIDKWLTTGQKAIEKLHEILPEPKPSDLQSLLLLLQINPELMKYNIESDSFS